jgi:hypothetical protein
MTPEWKAAARAGDLDALDRLLERGQDIDALDEYNQTALMTAARNGATAVAVFLIGRGAKLNHTAKYHLTALMLAVINNHPPVVRALVEAGADVTVTGRGAPGFEDKTALDLARARSEGQENDITRILRAATEHEG